MADLLREALDHVEGIVRNVPEAGAHADTPCPDWDVEALVNHMVAGNRYFAAAARGETPDRAMFADDHIGTDPTGAYERSAGEASSAWARPGVLDETLGSGLPGRVLWGIHLVEILGHGWDLAHAAGLPRDVPIHLVDAAMEVAGRMPAEQVRNPGVFGAEVEPGPDARPWDRLAAFLGRDPAVRP